MFDFITFNMYYADKRAMASRKRWRAKDPGSILNDNIKVLNQKVYLFKWNKFTKSHAIVLHECSATGHLYNIQLMTNDSFK